MKLAGYLAANPALRTIYEFKQKLCELLLHKGMNQSKCGKLAPQFLTMSLAEPMAELVSLGRTLLSWKDEIARMWRFTRNNGITEGFHTKIEVLQRQTYELRNFNNYRCGRRYYVEDRSESGHRPIKYVVPVGLLWWT